jgi:hypothetical protein
MAMALSSPHLRETISNKMDEKINAIIDIMPFFVTSKKHMYVFLQKASTNPRNYSTNKWHWHAITKMEYVFS